MYDYINRKYFKNEKGEENFYEAPPKYLNKEPRYVYWNIMTIDNDEETLNEKSLMPPRYTFVGEKEVYNYVKSIVTLD